MDKRMSLLMYFVGNISGLVILALVIMLTTFTAFNLANVYVILNDGMSQRAYTILNRQNPDELSKFFTLSYLSSEPLFNNEQYINYIIEDYEYELKIEKMWIWPWQKNTKVVVNENIPDDSWDFSIMQPANGQDDAQGQQEDSTQTDVQGSESEPPSWRNGKKIVEFKKTDGRWKISNIIYLD